MTLWIDSYSTGWSYQGVRPLGRVFASWNGWLVITHYDGWPNPPQPAWDYKWGGGFYHDPDAALSGDPAGPQYEWDG